MDNVKLNFDKIKKLIRMETTRSAGESQSKEQKVKSQHLFIFISLIVDCLMYVHMLIYQSVINLM